MCFALWKNSPTCHSSNKSLLHHIEQKCACCILSLFPALPWLQFGKFLFILNPPADGQWVRKRTGQWPCWGSVWSAVGPVLCKKQRSLPPPLLTAPSGRSICICCPPPSASFWWPLQRQNKRRVKSVVDIWTAGLSWGRWRERDACVPTVWVGYAGRTTLWKSCRQHQAQEVRRSFLHLAARGRELALCQFLLQRLVYEEADHGLRDAGIGCSQASVEASDPLCLVNIAGALQGVHLLLPSGPEKSSGLFALAANLVQSHSDTLTEISRTWWMITGLLFIFTLWGSLLWGSKSNYSHKELLTISLPPCAHKATILCCSPGEVSFTDKGETPCSCDLK